VGADGRVGEPCRRTDRRATRISIRTDNTNRYVFVPHLGTDQVFQFLFDQRAAG
jgi:6-phosphogluconolactonase